MTTITEVIRPDGGSVNGHPKGPRPEVLDAVLQASVPSLRRCFDSWADLPPAYDADVKINYRVLPNGRTAGISITGQLARPVDACVQGVFEALRFGEFEGDEISGNFPFGYHRTAPIAPVQLR